jgi:type IV secretion system protein VirB3
MSEHEPPGFRIALHTTISSPITIAGVPRMMATAIATITVLIAVSFQQPWFGIPFGMLLWAVAYAATRSDPYFFRVLDRHVRHKSHWDG